MRSCGLMMPRRGIVILTVCLGMPFVLSLCASLGCVGLSTQAVRSDARPVVRYWGPVFWTGMSDSEAEAVDVDAAGKIVAVHARRPTDPQGLREERLPGVFAVPGLHDAHLHLAGIGQARELIDLRGTSDPAQIRERIRAFAEAHPELPILKGRGWDQTRFPSRRFPSWRDLDGVTERPVILTRVDGHAVWVNRVLLEAAGVDRDTVDPPGGRLLRDARGAPTGVLIDRAMSLVRDRLPPATATDWRRWMRQGSQACADAGLVAVHDMGMGLAALQALVSLDREGALPLRVFVYLGDQPEHMAWLTAKSQAGLDGLRPSARVEVRGLKLFADGALGSRGAALLADYSDDPGHRGQLLTPLPVLTARLTKLHELGLQAAVHAIGDRAVKVALDAIAAAQGGRSDRRHRIEHAQVVASDDFERFSALGVVASMQPTHATSDMRWAEKRVGATRIAGAYAWQRMRRVGARLAFGSDAPVESERVLLGLYAAMSRQDPSGHPPGGWRVMDRLDFKAALAGFSAEAAHAVHAEHRLGLLRPGHDFDLSCFDRDLREGAATVLAARPVATVVAGVLRPASSPLQGGD